MEGSVIAEQTGTLQNQTRRMSNSVTGQRSNQAGLRPHFVSSGFDKPLNFLFIPTAN